MILSIDMEKCFDKISYSAVFSALDYFNFGPNFICWVKLFYTDFVVYTQNFGYFSDFFTKETSVNQGCIISPAIFLLTAESLANRLRNHPGIHGIKVNNIEYLISQFADDMDLYLPYNQVIFNNVLQVLQDIEANTGLTVSYDKTRIYCIGSLANSDAKLYFQQKLCWTNEPINTLGMEISNDVDKIMQNFQTIINKIETVANIWYYCQITLSGKIVLINALMGSQLVYEMQVLHEIPPAILAKVDQVIVKFLWKDKKPKISLRTL